MQTADGTFFIHDCFYSCEEEMVSCDDHERSYQVNRKQVQLIIKKIKVSWQI